MFDTLHGAITIWLLFYKHRMGLQSPLFSTKVRLERPEQSISVLRRNTRHIPLFNKSGSRIDETHGEVLYAYIYT
jgi:hypothetical protein